jgi:hypothetical protein
MKAWFVFIPDEWGELIHAETRGKAKVKIMHEFGVDEFIDLQATRVPKLDGKAFTFKNLAEAEFQYLDEDGNPLKEKDLYNACGCEICEGAK